MLRSIIKSFQNLKSRKKDLRIEEMEFIKRQKEEELNILKALEKQLRTYQTINKGQNH